MNIGKLKEVEADVWVADNTKERMSGIFLTKEQFIEVYNRIWEAAANHKEAETFGRIPNSFPDQTTFLKQLFERG